MVIFHSYVSLPEGIFFVDHLGFGGLVDGRAVNGTVQHVHGATGFEALARLDLCSGPTYANLSLWYPGVNSWLKSREETNPTRLGLDLKHHVRRETRATKASPELVERNQTCT